MLSLLVYGFNNEKPLGLKSVRRVSHRDKLLPLDINVELTSKDSFSKRLLPVTYSSKVRSNNLLKEFTTALSPTPLPSYGPTFVSAIEKKKNDDEQPPQREYRIQAEMSLVYCDLLDDDSLKVWEDTTSNFLSQRLATQFNDSERMLINIICKITVTSQNRAQRRKNRMVFNKESKYFEGMQQNNHSDNDRSLEEMSIILSFNIELSFRSNTEEHRIDIYIEQSFNDEMMFYIWALQDTNNAQFHGINSVVVDIIKLDSLFNQRQDPPSEKSTRYFVTMISSGVALVTLISVVSIRLWKKRQSHLPLDSDGDGSHSDNAAIIAQPNDDRSVLFPVENHASLENVQNIGFDDVSDLESKQQSPFKSITSFMTTSEHPKNVQSTGDSLKTGQGSNLETEIAQLSLSDENVENDDHCSVDDATNASCREYLSQRTIFSDDSSWERLYGRKSNIVEITAPPGVLGIVLDSAQQPIPTIYSIEQSSPLRDFVKVGDRLISVNVGLGNIDTTELSARKVSQLLSSFKAEKRCIVLVRDK